MLCLGKCSLCGLAVFQALRIDMDVVEASVDQM